MPIRRTKRPTTIAAAAGAVLLATATACSSSSSPSTSPTPTGPPPPTSLHGHNAGGPNGIINTPASNPPSSGVPGGSETFPHVTEKLDRRIVNHVLAMPGVQHAAYYPQFEQFQVYYYPAATDADRDAVYAYVTARTGSSHSAPSSQPRKTTARRK